MTIRDVRADHYRIPLPVALSDSTHGTIRGFELITVRVGDADGGEGVGYTYTVGTGGAAVPPVTRTSTLRRTRLAAKSGSRSYFPGAHLSSMAMFFPST
jgi:hypothetical protein